MEDPADLPAVVAVRHEDEADHLLVVAHEAASAEASAEAAVGVEAASQGVDVVVVVVALADVDEAATKPGKRGTLTDMARCDRARRSCCCSVICSSGPRLPTDTMIIRGRSGARLDVILPYRTFWGHVVYGSSWV